MSARSSIAGAAGLVLALSGVLTLALLVSIDLSADGIRAGELHLSQTPSPTPDPTPPCAVGTATPPGEGCIPCPTAGPFGIQTTCFPVGHYRKWGDHNCSDAADPGDALLALRFDGGVPTEQEPHCPDLGQNVSVQGSGVLPWGDLDCSEAVDAVDALKGLRLDAGLLVSQSAPCPDAGENALLNPVN
ncbi:MAG TPA: hypothetical protein VMR52_02230 [Dehalococcoidia bacterium]|nr:hypothetical protein [Dehalococcoidia bacterium]